MRAQNQTDLIYKRGQAGVTKASVTIVFDNSNPSEGPVGLEHYPQITVTRQVSLSPFDQQLHTPELAADRPPQPVEVLAQWSQVNAAVNTDAVPECSAQHQQS